MNDDVCLISPEPLDILVLHGLLLRPEWGGQAVFTGSTRSPNQGIDIVRLEYEVYPELCQAVMQTLIAEARQRWPVGRVVLAHRSGVVPPAEPSIFIGVASSHRQACLEALPWLLDEAKARLPVWKLEVAATGEHWVEGASVAAPALK
jgi:MoaE-MoaD fusion protein